MRISPKSEEILQGGWYPAVITQAEEMETKYGEKLLVSFDVDGSKEDAGTVEVDAWLTLPEEGKQAHPKSNIAKWGRMLFGPGDWLTEDLPDLHCDVFIEEGESNDGERKNFVRKLRPAKEGKVDESDFSELPF